MIKLEQEDYKPLLLKELKCRVHQSYCGATVNISRTKSQVEKTKLKWCLASFHLTETIVTKMNSNTKKHSKKPFNLLLSNLKGQEKLEIKLWKKFFTISNQTLWIWKALYLTLTSVLVENFKTLYALNQLTSIIAIQFNNRSLIKEIDVSSL